MKLCGKCGRTPLPYVIVLFVAGISAFLTWLTLPLLGVPAELNGVLTAAAFILITFGLLAYMLSCIRRHCRHHGVAHG